MRIRPAGLDAVDAGQHQVEHDQIRPNAPRRVDRRLAIGHDLDREPVAHEVAGDEARERLLVVDHQSAPPAGHRPRAASTSRSRSRS